MKIQPLADRILDRTLRRRGSYCGRHHHPGFSKKEKPLKGKVLAVGGGTKDEEMVLAAWRRSALRQIRSKTEIEFEGTKYLMMRQSDVLAVIK